MFNLVGPDWQYPPRDPCARVSDEHVRSGLESYKKRIEKRLGERHREQAQGKSGPEAEWHEGFLRQTISEINEGIANLEKGNASERPCVAR
jgi:hypothetical protein